MSNEEMSEEDRFEFKVAMLQSCAHWIAFLETATQEEIEEYKESMIGVFSALAQATIWFAEPDTRKVAVERMVNEVVSDFDVDEAIKSILEDKND